MASNYLKFLGTLLILAGLAFSSGCQEEEVSLPFESVDQAEGTGTGNQYSNSEPDLMIASNTEQMESLWDYVSPSAQAELENLDFEQYIVVGVFQGTKGSDRYSVEILKIALSQDSITVFADFREPDPEMEQVDVETSPYHLVKINRSGLEGVFSFSLTVGDNTLLTKTIRIS